MLKGMFRFQCKICSHPDDVYAKSQTGQTGRSFSQLYFHRWAAQNKTGFTLFTFISFQAPIKLSAKNYQTNSMLSVRWESNPSIFTFINFTPLQTSLQTSQISNRASGKDTPVCVFDYSSSVLSPPGTFLELRCPSTYLAVNNFVGHRRESRRGGTWFIMKHKTN